MVSKEIFSVRLRETMEAAGLQQSQVAKELGIVKQAVNNWCVGLNTPTLDVTHGLALLLGVSIDYLVGLSDDPQRR
ncbi:transcriptional regulator [Clostridia bacterium]|nr:transcriptional regulator [Clostridia bacterium]